MQHGAQGPTQQLAAWRVTARHTLTPIKTPDAVAESCARRSLQDGVAGNLRQGAGQQEVAVVADGHGKHLAGGADVRKILGQDYLRAAKGEGGAKHRRGMHGMAMRGMRHAAIFWCISAHYGRGGQRYVSDMRMRP